MLLSYIGQMKIRHLVFCCSLTLLSCSPDKKTPKAIPLALEEYFSEQFSPEEPGGAIMLVVRDSVVFSRGYGLADMRTKEAITTKTLFNLGSISKTFVANGILMLQERGQLSVEDSLYQYFSGFRNKEIAGKVRISHLLTHTSGLPDLRDVSGDSVFYLTAKDAENWYPITQTDTLEFEPGSQFHYSNPAYNGLALIIEKVSGIKWQQYIARNIFDPSGMRTSTITDGPHPDNGVSHAYVKEGEQWIEDDYGEEPTFPAAGNGGVWSSVEELARYERAIQHSVFLSHGAIEDSRTVKKFENWSGTRPFQASWSWVKPAKREGHFDPAVGWSWFIGTTDKGYNIASHTGSQGGFLCNYVSIPGKQIFFVILCNTPKDVYAYSDKIMSLLDL